MVDVALIILRDRPVQLRFEIGIRLMQRNRNSDGVFFFHAGDRAIVVLDIDRAGTGFPSVEAVYEAACRPCGRRVLAKAEGIKNGLDSDRVKAVSAFRPPIDGGDQMCIRDRFAT